METHPDLALPDVMPIDLTRSYRQGDTVTRSFGVGTNFSYGFFLQWTNALIVGVLYDEAAAPHRPALATPHPQRLPQPDPNFAATDRIAPYSCVARSPTTGRR